MPTNDGFSGVSTCYVFKSRLQEYAQKKGLPTPVYETIKEGPSHEPSFRSTVIVNDIRYDSLPGFFNRKAAEQSAAEVALMELAKCDEVNDSISQPVHETGLCKNLLQEYAQKMNYAIPLYLCQKNESPGRGTLFKCTVEIGGIHYIGASAKTKKEAEIKAARTALLAIQLSASESSHNSIGNCQLTVIPFRKRGAETAAVLEEAMNVPKAKKARFRKKTLKKKHSGNKVDHNQGETIGNKKDGQAGSESDKNDASVVQGTGHQLLPMLSTSNSEDGRLVPESSERETTDVTGALVCHISGDFGNGFAATVNFDQSNHGVCAETNGDTAKFSGATLVQIGAATVMAGLNPAGERIEAGAGQ
ncbi:double-stranded RNA-binding protein 1 isoform X1 [Ricinus communis]|uniref:double-stranded RNA-binding protein 1 isoform X1 n=1 Tax=Ricinus communis TaxID=3988 RepID=UPI00201AAA7D|nr:double-stranded RNA-binding protein 1 isoform X1 [Ricinus communis]